MIENERQCTIIHKKKDICFLFSHSMVHTATQFIGHLTLFVEVCTNFVQTLVSGFASHAEDGSTYNTV